MSLITARTKRTTFEIYEIRIYDIISVYCSDIQNLGLLIDDLKKTLIYEDASRLPFYISN